MDVGQMCEYISYLVDDLNFSYFTKPQLYRFINQSVSEAQKKLIDCGQMWYLKVTPDSGGGSIPLVVNVGSYSQPADMMEINRIECVQNPGINENRYTLTSCTLNQKDMFPLGPGQPLAFYLGKDTIEILPAPNAVAGQILRVFYNFRVTDVAADADVIDVPVEYHEYVANLAAEKCFFKDGRTDVEVLRRYINEVEGRLDRKAMERMKDRAHSVVQTDDGGMSGSGFY